MVAAVVVEGEEAAVEKMEVEVAVEIKEVGVVEVAVVTNRYVLYDLGI